MRTVLTLSAIALTIGAAVLLDQDTPAPAPVRESVIEEPTPTPGTPTPLPGDDNGDGVIHEEESGWDCATMGNHQCDTVFRV